MLVEELFTLLTTFFLEQYSLIFFNEDVSEHKAGSGAVLGLYLVEFAKGFLSSFVVSLPKTKSRADWHFGVFTPSLHAASKSTAHKLPETSKVSRRVVRVFISTLYIEM